MGSRLSAILPGQPIGFTTTHGAKFQLKCVEELVTLDTGDALTDLAFVLPQHAFLISVSYRVTTTITTATNWKFGLAGIADLNDTVLGSDTNTNLTAGNTGSIACFGSGSPAAARTLRVTAQATPGAGAIRFVIFYAAVTLPTS